MRGLALAVLVMVLGGCASGGADDDPGVAAEVSPFKLDAVRTMNGETVDVDAALERGETVAFVFWQVWCAPCKREAPEVARAQRDHGNKIRFLGVVPGKDDTVDDAEVTKTAKDWGYEFPQVRDRDLSITKGLRVRGTPTIVVLGKNRRPLYDAHHVPDDWTVFEGEPR